MIVDVSVIVPVAVGNSTFAGYGNSGVGFAGGASGVMFAILVGQTGDVVVGPPLAGQPGGA